MITTNSFCRAESEPGRYASTFKPLNLCDPISILWLHKWSIVPVGHTPFFSALDLVFETVFRPFIDEIQSSPLLSDNKKVGIAEPSPSLFLFKTVDLRII